MRLDAGGLFEHGAGRAAQSRPLLPHLQALLLSEGEEAGRHTCSLLQVVDIGAQRAGPFRQVVGRLRAAERRLRCRMRPIWPLIWAALSRLVERSMQPERMMAGRKPRRGNPCSDSGRGKLTVRKLFPTRSSARLFASGICRSILPQSTS